MATYRFARSILYTALFINLAVDCSGRVSEFVYTPGTNKGKCLPGNPIQLFAFRRKGQITLQARVRFTDLKGSYGTTEERSKIIPLRLLPLELAAEDSLRQLVILGMIDGVF